MRRLLDSMEIIAERMAEKQHGKLSMLLFKLALVSVVITAVWYLSW